MSPSWVLAKAQSLRCLPACPEAASRWTKEKITWSSEATVASDVPAKKSESKCLRVILVATQTESDRKQVAALQKKWSIETENQEKGWTCRVFNGRSFACLKRSKAAGFWRCRLCTLCFFGKSAVQLRGTQCRRPGQQQHLPRRPADTTATGKEKEDFIFFLFFFKFPFWQWSWNINNMHIFVIALHLFVIWFMCQKSLITKPKFKSQYMLFHRRHVVEWPKCTNAIK